jgi:hypothetical protein
MGRRMPRDLRPSLEHFERRELLSAITDLMASSQQASYHAVGTNTLAAAQSGAQPQTTVSLASNGFVPSKNSIAIPTNQGPQGPNLALVPTGILTPHEIKRELFSAVFKGPFTVGPGRTST